MAPPLQNGFTTKGPSMQTKHTLETIETNQLASATGGAICMRESMGYVNPAGTCQDQWSSAPNSGQNGWMGLDSNFKPLKSDQFKQLNEGRANIGLAPITAEQQRAHAR
jgi:hypothetical protein